jgi:inorganic pyrophosphatase
MPASIARAARSALAVFRRQSSTSAAHPPPLFFTAGAGAGARYISPWHDIPLSPAGANPAIFNFVCEIPRGTRAKFEIDTGARFNAIVQDSTKAGAPRSYALDSLVNYGALPQTYEDPAHVDAWARAPGDGDPLDVCEIGGARPAATGDAYAVKVIGALAMLDGGECDWKLLAVRTDDPLAAAVDDVTAAAAPDGVKRAADAVREWFRTYKIPEGKGENDFAFGGAWLDVHTTLQIVAATHKQWRDALARPAAAGGKGPWLPQAGWAPPHAHAFAPAKGAAALAGLATTRTPPARGHTAA